MERTTPLLALLLTACCAAKQPVNYCAQSTETPVDIMLSTAYGRARDYCAAQPIEVRNHVAPYLDSLLALRADWPALRDAIEKPPNNAGFVLVWAAIHPALTAGAVNEAEWQGMYPFAVVAALDGCHLGFANPLW
jgi:hypothetical protein